MDFSHNEIIAETVGNNIEKISNHIIYWAFRL